MNFAGGVEKQRVWKRDIAQLRPLLPFTGNRIEGHGKPVRARYHDAIEEPVVIEVCMISRLEF